MKEDYAVIREHEHVFVGDEPSCNKVIEMFQEYDKYNSYVIDTVMVKQPSKGTEQDYINKVLDDNLKFEYGY